MKHPSLYRLLLAIGGAILVFVLTICFIPIFSFPAMYAVFLFVFYFIGTTCISDAIL